MKRGKGVSRTFYDTIHKRAEASFPIDLLKTGQEGSSANNPDWEENYELWVDHWLKTAEKLRDEFVTEGLTQTVEVLQKIIDDNRKQAEYHRNRNTAQKVA